MWVWKDLSTGLRAGTYVWYTTRVVPPKQHIFIASDSPHDHCWKAERKISMNSVPRSSDHHDLNILHKIIFTISGYPGGTGRHWWISHICYRHYARPLSSPFVTNFVLMCMSSVSTHIFKLAIWLTYNVCLAFHKKPTIPLLTNSMAYGTRGFNVAFTRALQ